MKTSLSKRGLILSLIYVFISIFLISTQGLFGESFIALILGLPWTLILASVEYFNVRGVLLYVFIFTPLVLNTLILYFIGSLIQRK